jgi:hypothetical protein
VVAHLGEDGIEILDQTLLLLLDCLLRGEQGLNGFDDGTGFKLDRHNGSLIRHNA